MENTEEIQVSLKYCEFTWTNPDVNSFPDVKGADDGRLTLVVAVTELASKSRGRWRLELADDPE